MTPDQLSGFDAVFKSISVPGLLALAVFATWWLMNKHHNEVVQQLKDEADKGWKEADKARVELSANNTVLDKVNDSIKDLTRTMGDFASRMSGKR